MKIFAISDLHLAETSNKPMNIFGSNWDNYVEKIISDWQARVSEDDVVLIAGDISWAMQLENALIDLKPFYALKGKKVFIRGNHDYWWKSVSRIRAELPEDFFVIQNDAIKFENVVICGSRGWTVEGSNDFTEEDRKLYLREAERLKLALRAADKLRCDGDKLIAMIHFPPFNVKREDSLFTKLFEEHNVNKVVYGHLHGKECKVDLRLKKNDIEYFLTSCDQVRNTLVEIL